MDDKDISLGLDDELVNTQELIDLEAKKSNGKELGL